MREERGVGGWEGGWGRVGNGLSQGEAGGGLRGVKGKVKGESNIDAPQRHHLPSTRSAKACDGESGWYGG